MRFSWNFWPATRQELQECEVPLGCMISPMYDDPNMCVVEYEPVRCRQSGVILNPHCAIDHR